jgi:hypothetical protein
MLRSLTIAITAAYMWPRPGDTTPVQKESLVTKVGKQVYGVGYCK